MLHYGFAHMHIISTLSLALLLLHLVAQVIIINAPMVFDGVYQVGKHMMTVETQQKIRVSCVVVEVAGLKGAMCVELEGSVSAPRNTCHVSRW